jgi:hypothetical protein
MPHWACGVDVGEFFYNKSTGLLYLFYNGTGAPPAEMTVVAPQKQVLINMTGTQWRPVKTVSGQIGDHHSRLHDSRGTLPGVATKGPRILTPCCDGHQVNLHGITFKAAAYTYMMPHGVPSAGDWALDRFGAVFLEGTEGAMINNCTFERLDGNAVMVSGYNRNATIQNSDFAFIGGNGVAAWGYTNETSGDNHPQAGVDGTDGEHPRYTTVLSNTIREVGLYEKQSSFFVQAKTAQSIIKGNVFFNGPRAGINVGQRARGWCCRGGLLWVTPRGILTPRPG